MIETVAAALKSHQLIAGRKSCTCGWFGDPITEFLQHQAEGVAAHLTRVEIQPGPNMRRLESFRPQFGTGPIPLKYEKEARYCETHPGKWVKIGETSTEQAAWALSQKVKNGRCAVFRPAGHFASYSAGLDVFAAYVGEPGAGQS